LDCKKARILIGDDCDCK